MVDDIQFTDGDKATSKDGVVLRLQIISVTEDDGSNGVDFTLQQLRRAIGDVNSEYARAGVQLKWDEATDFAVLKSSYLNRDFDLTADTMVQQTLRFFPGVALLHKSLFASIESY